MVHTMLHTRHQLFSVVQPIEALINTHAVWSRVRSSAKLEMARSSVFWVVTAVSAQHIGFILQGCPETNINSYRQTPCNNQTDKDLIYTAAEHTSCMNTKSPRNEGRNKLAAVLHGRNPLIGHFMIPGSSETKSYTFHHNQKC